MIRLFHSFSVLGTVLASALLLGFPTDVQAQRIAATVDSTESVIEYTGSATMHNWTGTSRSVTGSLALDIDTPDSSRVVVRVPVASFESGPDRRDRKMREVTEADQYPMVEFRATDIRPSHWGRTSNGHAGRWAVTGDLTFHGQTHPVEASVDVRVTDDSVRAHAQFPVSLTRFDVERPQLMWVAPIGDTIRIDARIVGAVEDVQSAESRLTDEQNEVTNTRRIASTDLRDLPEDQYAGQSAGLHSEARLSPDDEHEWIVAFYGFTDRPTGLAAAQSVALQADRQSVDPLRIEGTTRTLDNGTTVEISRLYFSQPAFERIAEATTLSATVGSAQFPVDWMARRDLRLILDRVSADTSRPVTARDEK